MWSSASHCRKARLSATCACGKRRGRGIAVRRSLRCRRASIGCQSCDGRAHVGQHALDAGHQGCALLGVDQAIDLDVHPRLARGIGRIAAQRRSPRARPPASRSTAKIGCTIRCSVRPWRLISVVVESTRNGMSSLTIWITECRDAQPSSATEGLKTRTLACPARAPRQLPVRQQRTEQVLGRTSARSSSSSRLKVLARETFEHRSPLGGHMGRGEREDGIEPFATQRIGRGAHRQSPLASRGPKESGAPRGLF